MSFLRSTMRTKPAVHHRHVAGAQETVGHDHLGGLLGAVPVALHHLRAADAQLAGFAQRQILAVVVANGDLGRRDRQADAPL
jgi:hypothetical protein